MNWSTTENLLSGSLSPLRERVRERGKNNITLPLSLLYEERSLRRTVRLLSAYKGGIN